MSNADLSPAKGQIFSRSDCFFAGIVTGMVLLVLFSFLITKDRVPHATPVPSPSGAAVFQPAGAAPERVPAGAAIPRQPDGAAQPRVPGGAAIRIPDGPAIRVPDAANHFRHNPNVAPPANLRSIR